MLKLFILFQTREPGQRNVKISCSHLLGMAKLAGPERLGGKTPLKRERENLCLHLGVVTAMNWGTTKGPANTIQTMQEDPKKRYCFCLYVSILFATVFSVLLNLLIFFSPYIREEQSQPWKASQLKVSLVHLLPHSIQSHRYNETGDFPYVNFLDNCSIAQL